MLYAKRTEEESDELQQALQVPKQKVAVDPEDLLNDMINMKLADKVPQRKLKIDKEAQRRKGKNIKRQLKF